MKSLEWGERIPTGLFYQDLSAVELTQQINLQKPSYHNLPPAKQPVVDNNNQNRINLNSIFNELII